MELLRERHFAAGGGNVLLSVMLCLAGVWLGLLASGAFYGVRPAAG
jgi:fluoride ion exporter CrcB/FEX